MMEAKKKYEKPAFRLVTDLGSILECLYEVYGTDGTMLIAGNKLSDTVIYPFIRMIKKKCKAVDAEKLNLMLWKIYMVSSRKEEFVTAAKKELQPYLSHLPFTTSSFARPVLQDGHQLIGNSFS